MNIIVISVLALIVALLITIYQTLVLKEDGVEFKSVFKTQKTLTIYLLYAIILIITGGIVWKRISNTDILLQFKWLILIWTLTLVAWIDYKKKVIDWRLQLFLLFFGCLYYFILFVTDNDSGKYIAIYAAIGAAIGGITMLFMYFISRGGLGFGDVKIFALVGLYVGTNRILETMIYASFVSVIVSLALLISKKAKIKDQLPFAPCIWLGVIITALFFNGN